MRDVSMEENVFFEENNYVLILRKIITYCLRGHKFREKNIFLRIICNF